MPTYEIEANGHKYKVTAADDAQAERVGKFIHEQVAKGNYDFEGVELPDKGKYINGRNAAGVGLHGATKEASFNASDEISAFLSAGLPGYAALDNWANPGRKQEFGWGQGFWDRVAHNQQDYQGYNQAEEEAHPVANGVGRITGAVAGGGVGAKALLAAGSKLAPRAAISAAGLYDANRIAHPIKTAAATGAAIAAPTAAISGFNAGDTLENRVRGSNVGAAAGLVLGPAAGVALTTLAPAVARYASVIFGRAPEKEAVQQIVEKLAQDGYDVTSPAGVQALRSELSKFTGKPVALADIGAATRSRAGVGLRAPSDFKQKAEDIVLNRAAGQKQRLVSDIKQFVSPRTDVHALDEDLAQQLETQALPMRDKALFERRVTPPEIPMALESAPELPPLPPPVELPAGGVMEEPAEGLTRFLGNAPPVGPIKPMDDNFMARLAAKAEPEPVAPPPFTEPTPPVPAPPPPVLGPPAPKIDPRIPRQVEDPALNALLNEHPLGQKALAVATKTLNAERATRELQGQPTDDLPEVLMGAQQDYRSLDYVKRFLDDQVHRLFSRQESAFAPAQANAVKELRNAIRERARSENDEYGQYLDMYGGTSEMRDALTAGRDFQNLDPEQIAALQGDHSDAAQELYRAGVARNLQDTVRSSKDAGTYPASRILNSDESREQLAATGVPQTAVNDLMSRIGQERTMNRLPSELRGSDTAQRVEAARDADAGVHASLPFNPVSKFSWLGALTRGVLNKSSTARNAKVNAAILPRLLETNPAMIENIITELTAQGERSAALALKRAMRARRAARTSGMVIGSPVSFQEEQ